jgi:hypothetical protein
VGHCHAPVEKRLSFLSDSEESILILRGVCLLAGEFFTPVSFFRFPVVADHGSPLGARATRPQRLNAARACPESIEGMAAFGRKKRVAS